jgi:GT2 family glycosyltransferase
MADQSTPTPSSALELAAGIPFTSIVIPVYNQLNYTRQCVEAIDRTAPQGSWELIVVDNASADGTAEWLAGLSLRHGSVRVIRNEANLGFGRACNQGMAAAKGEGVVLLNNDAVVLGDWLAGLWAPLRGDARGGMSGPITNFGRPEQTRRLRDPREGEEAPAVFDEWIRAHAGVHMPVDVLSGFCLLMTRGVIERLGGFDPCYGLGYFEDDDFSLRARLAGFPLWICEGVLVYHHGAVTSQATGLVASSTAHLPAKWAIFRDKWRLPADRQPHQFSVEEVRRLWGGEPPLYVPLTAV